MSLQIGDSPRVFFKAPINGDVQNPTVPQVTDWWVFFFFFRPGNIGMKWWKRSNWSEAVFWETCWASEYLGASGQALRAAVQLWMFPWNLSPPFIGHLGDETDHHGHINHLQY